jgi:serine/threonine protein kinase
MVSIEGIIKLIDFGCSKQFNKTINTITNITGTPQWTAPEMLRKNGSVKSDIWSLGCTIFEMVCFLTMFFKNLYFTNKFLDQ